MPFNVGFTGMNRPIDGRNKILLDLGGCSQWRRQ